MCLGKGISVTEDHTLLGDPKCGSLTQNEMELFAQVVIVGYEDTDILMYFQLLLNKTEWYQLKHAQKLQRFLHFGGKW